MNVDGKEGWVPSSTLTAIADRSSANNSSVGSSRDLSVEYSDQSDTEGKHRMKQQSTQSVTSLVPRLVIKLR